MYLSTRSNLNAARIMLVAVWGFVCILILAAPILLSHACRTAASILYLSFSCVCHQIPERSFAIAGRSLAVCHRCCGIYAGLALGSCIKFPFMHRSPQARRLWILAASVPLLFDAILPCTGLWTNSCCSRFFAGLLFGILISSLLVLGVAEFLSEAPWRKIAHCKAQFEEMVHD